MDEDEGERANIARDREMPSAMRMKRERPHPRRRRPRPRLSLPRRKRLKIQVKTRPLRDDGMGRNALTRELDDRRSVEDFFYCPAQNVGFFYQTAVI